MQQFSLCSSKLKRISSIIFLISACSIFVTFGILVDNLLVKILSFSIFAICFADLFIIEVIPKKVFFEDGVLELRYLSKNICIKLQDVVWYSKNDTGLYTLFCKSDNNLCLFYHGKKHYVSIKEQDIIETYLIKNEVPKSTVEKESYFKLKSMYEMYLYSKFIIFPFIASQIIRSIKIDGQYLKYFIYAGIIIMIFCGLVFFINSIIGAISRKQKGSGNENITRRLFKLFLGIPVISTLLMAVIAVLVLVTVVFILRDFGITNLQSILMPFNLFVSISNILVYFVIYKIILVKTNFTYGLGDSIKREWADRKKLYDVIGKTKKQFLIITLLTVIIAVVFSFISLYLKKKFGVSKDITIVEISFLFVPIFEEFIFRKIYFQYCEINKIKHAFILNVIIFSFAHIIPMPYVFLLGVILAYCYKKYDSLILNTVIHFLLNLLGLSIPLILKLIR